MLSREDYQKEQAEIEDFQAIEEEIDFAAYVARRKEENMAHLVEVARRADELDRNLKEKTNARPTTVDENS